ncbi:MAG: oxidoreductase [Candidatus Angelobacter sp.]|jgi:2,4-dienoyl-CoA reductase-like NADH-dependent reductase (Old Yellow Enzyme family)|nr:oxidoreductase [Candidatus Angelobacter sp.]
MPGLFDSFQLRGLHFRNRVTVSPMCQYSSVNGFANDWHLVHLGSRAVGGAALVIAEAAAVTPEGRITPQDLGIWDDRHVEMLKRIFDFIAAQGAFAGVQLAHAGRKASTNEPWKGGTPISPEQCGWTPIYAPSPIPFAEGYQVPAPLTVEQIRKVVQDFAAGARRALAAGASVVEIHAAHGYLLNSFLSPLTNKRNDEYGGSFQNRIRLLCEVLQAVRSVWPEQNPVFIRISATDWADGAGGWTIEDSIALSKILKPLGADLIDCSSGGNLPNVKIPVGPGYQVPFAERIRKEAGIPTAAVGMITEAAQADQTIRTGQADIVLFAREMLRNPYWPLYAARRLHQDVQWPNQYQRAKLR